MFCHVLFIFLSNLSKPLSFFNNVHVYYFWFIRTSIVILRNEEINYFQVSTDVSPTYSGLTKLCLKCKWCCDNKLQRYFVSGDLLLQRGYYFIAAWIHTAVECRRSGLIYRSVNSCCTRRPALNEVCGRHRFVCVWSVTHWIILTAVGNFKVIKDMPS